MIFFRRSANSFVIRHGTPTEVLAFAVYTDGDRIG